MKYLIGFLFCLLLSSEAFGQWTYSGNIVDALDKQYLEGVTVGIAKTQENSLTNNRGYFNLKAQLGDTLLISYPGFVTQKLVLTQERFLYIELQDEARLLPTFTVRSEASPFRFKDGKLYLVDPNEAPRPSTKGQVTTGATGSPTGGFGIYGPISYFSKESKNAREYAKKKAWHARREGYYAVVESDSVRQNLMIKHQLSRQEWDKLLIRYNEGNLSHEFLDWPRDRVYTSLDVFLAREKNWIY
ncbi:carboxypeptidase-like regulatory domain-containing protein [Algoriphagus namhaensis]